MSTSTGRRPFRIVLLATLAAAVVLAVRAAIADKGGSYDPTPARS